MKVIRYEPGDANHASFVEVEVDFGQHFEKCNNRRYYSSMAGIKKIWRKVVAVSDCLDNWSQQSLLNMAVAVLGGFFFLYLIFGVTMTIIHG